MPLEGFTLSGSGKASVIHLAADVGNLVHSYCLIRWLPAPRLIQ